MDSVILLGRALDQTGDLLDHVRPAVLTAPTPCADWDVAALADHLVRAPANLLAVMRGDDPDWTDRPHPNQEWGMAFRIRADDLIHAWHQRQHEEDDGQAAWQCAELAVHDWDLATALGISVRHLDGEVAEVGLAFLRENLTPDNRGAAFAPEQPAGTGAGPYQRIAAYAGRSVLPG